MGYLLSLDRERLTRMAEAWGIGHEQPAAAIYNALTNPWHLASVRERLSPATQAILEALLEHKGGPLSLSTLATYVGEREADLPRRVAPLVRRGLVIAAADKSLSVADEVVASLKRLNRLMTGPDPSVQTVESFLAGKSAADLQRLAQRWQVPNAGTQLKRELIVELCSLLTSPEAVKSMARQLSPAAVRVLVLVARAGGRLEVSALKRRAGLDEPQLWAASRELIDLALVGESYAGGTRSLFTPVGLGVPEEPSKKAEPPSLKPISGPSVAEPQYALAWDLTTLLAWFRDANPPVGRLPLGAKQRNWLLARMHRDPAHAERLSFLLAAAIGLRLITGQGGTISTTKAAEEWDALDFGARTLAIFRWWLGASSWREGLAASDLELGGPIVFGLGRERTIRLLGALEPGAWYDVESFLAELRRREPLLFRDREALARAAGQTALERVARNWQRWDGRLALACINGPLRWLEAVSQRASGARRLISVTELGRWLFGLATADLRRWPPSESVAVKEDGSVVVLRPSGPAISLLSRLATLRPGNEGPDYVIDRAAVRRAVFAGFSAGGIVAALRAVAEVPPRLVRLIEEWAESVEPVTAWEGVVLQTRNVVAADRLAKSVGEGSAGVVRLGPTLLLVRDRSLLDALEPALREAGYLIRHDAGAPSGI